jgi:DNA-binding IclR family transcriptional regulator
MEEVFQHLLSHKRPALDAGERERIRAELPAVRCRGFAYASMKSTPKVRSVAAPVLDRHGRPIATISINWVTGPDDDERAGTYAVLVVSATRELSCKLGLASKQVDTLLPLHEELVGTTGA